MSMFHGKRFFGMRALRLCAFTACVLITSSLCVPFGGAAGLADLKKPYTHASQGEPITAVLSDFAMSQGYSASFSSGVRGTVSGDFSDMPPAKFLASIRSGFGVEAYSIGKTMYFYSQNERQRQVLRISSMSPSSMRATLLRMEALSPDLPSSASDKEKLLSFEGPDSYIEALVASIQMLEAAQQGDRVIRIFRLKHAWADDTTIEGASNSTVIPGVASVLRSVATGQGGGAATPVHKSGTSGKLLGSGMAAKGAEQGSAPQGGSAPGGSANIVAEPRMNAVIITDTEQMMPYYEAVIKELDKPVDLVEIHAAIVDINANFARDLGINWGGSASGGKWAGTTGSGGAPDGSLGAAANSGLSLTTIYTSGVNTFFSNVRALEDRGEAATLARPSVLTLDNVQASLEYTTTFYVKLEGKDAVDLVDVTSGTSLKVTPRIVRMPDGVPSRLTLSIMIMDGTDPVSSNKDTWVNDVPPVKKVTINTQAVVAEGQSLLIGGFYYETRSDSISGVPGLMDTSVVGGLFRSRGEEVRRMERLVLISPRIISHASLEEGVVPERVNNRGFAMDPTQNTYDMTQEPTHVKPSGGGCASTRGVAASGGSSGGIASPATPKAGK